MPGALPSRTGPLIVGRGDEDYVCGTCFAVVVRGIDPRTLGDVHLRCANCGALNETTIVA